MNEPLIKEASEQELKFLAEQASQYVKQGMSDIDARALAAEDWKKLENLHDKMGEQAWDEFTRKIGLHTILEDQIRRCLGQYKAAWEKANAPYTLDFKLYEKTRGGVGTSGNKQLIAGVSLILEKSLNGVWTVWRDKKIDFTHVGQMREAYKWKLALYEAMLHDLMAFGITYCLTMDDIKNGSTPK